MEKGNIEKKGAGFLFWGIVFTILGVLSLLRPMVIFAGIPVWSVCFFIMGLSNLIRSPRIQALFRSGPESSRRISRAALVMNILAAAIIVLTIGISLLG